MLISKKNYIFSKTVDYFFDLHNSILYIYSKRNLFLFKICFIYFFHFNKFILRFLFLSNFFFKGFISSIINFYKTYFLYYYFNLKLKGLGYRIKRLSKFLIRLYYNRTNYYYIHIPKTILLKYRTRRLFFLSTNKVALQLLILNLLFLKEFIIYKISGLMYSRQILLIKPGKKKFR